MLENNYYLYAKPTKTTYTKGCTNPFLCDRKITRRSYLNNTFDSLSIVSIVSYRFLPKKEGENKLPSYHTEFKSLAHIINFYFFFKFMREFYITRNFNFSLIQFH